MHISNITCDKDKVNEMKLLMLMLMNALDDAYAHEMQVPIACLTPGGYNSIREILRRNICR